MNPRETIWTLIVLTMITITIAYPINFFLLCLSPYAFGNWFSFGLLVFGFFPFFCCAGTLGQVFWDWFIEEEVKT